MQRLTTSWALVAAVLAPLGAAHAATGACAAGIQSLTQRIATVTDPHTRAVLDHDLQQARKEAAEGDEDECAEILAHADKVLATAK